MFLAFQVLDPWVTILMFPSVTCLNKLLSLVQSCLIFKEMLYCDVIFCCYLRKTERRTVVMNMKRSGR